MLGSCGAGRPGDSGAAIATVDRSEEAHVPNLPVQIRPRRRRAVPRRWILLTASLSAGILGATAGRRWRPATR